MTSIPDAAVGDISWLWRPLGAGMARKVGWYAVFLIVLISIYKSPANSAFAVREAVGVAASFFASFVQFVGDIIGAQ